MRSLLLKLTATAPDENSIFPPDLTVKKFESHMNCHDTKRLIRIYSKPIENSKNSRYVFGVKHGDLGRDKDL